jgi:hypothetical protein
MLQCPKIVFSKEDFHEKTLFEKTIFKESRFQININRGMFDRKTKKKKKKKKFGCNFCMEEFYLFLNKCEQFKWLALAIERTCVGELVATAFCVVFCNVH